MRVRMIQTRRGFHDPYRFFKYEAGRVYTLPQSLALSFIENGIALEEKSLDIPEVKAIGAEISHSSSRAAAHSKPSKNSRKNRR